jgi:hypothetical protein
MVKKIKEKKEQKPQPVPAAEEESPLHSATV